MLESSLLRTAYFGKNWDNVVAAGEFSISIISKMSFKFRSLSLIVHQNIPEPIPKFSKTIFFKNGLAQTNLSNVNLEQPKTLTIVQRSAQCLEGATERARGNYTM